MNISILIPLLNEAESLPELYEWITKVMRANHHVYEAIFIDDGSSDDSWKIINDLSLKDHHIKGIRCQKNFGQSQALHAGFPMPKGDVIITMDADLRDGPDEIPHLYAMINQQYYELVSGWKKNRYDPVVAEDLPSALFDWAARATSGVRWSDCNRGLKPYKKEVV